MDAINRKWCVYALRCPLTLEIRYIGITQDMSRRLQLHVGNRWKGSSPNEPLRLWMAELWSQHLIPAMSILHFAESKYEALRLEEQEVASRKSDPQLLNIQHAREHPGCDFVVPDLDGKPATLGKWAKRLGISRQRLYQRVRAYGIEDALSRPKNDSSRRVFVRKEPTVKRLSHAERKVRRSNMAAAVRDGQSVEQVASDFSVTVTTVLSAVRESRSCDVT